MEKYIDLHTHTTCSDGSMTPSELIRHAKKAGLAAIAVSDHDTVDGLREAEETAKQVDIEFIPAIEFSVISPTETHIVGLYVDRNNKELKQATANCQQWRKMRNAKTAENLMALGFDCPLEEAAALATGGVIGRAHFAKLMVDKGYVASVPEAFDKYLAHGRPAYADGRNLSDEDAISVIHASGGVAILAHPHLIRLSDDALFAYLQKLKAAGLDGLEGYYSEFTPQMEETFRGFAKTLGLLLSGGSDFHGANKPHIAIGTGFGNLKIPYSLLYPIRERCRKL